MSEGVYASLFFGEALFVLADKFIDQAIEIQLVVRILLFLFVFFSSLPRILYVSGSPERWGKDMGRFCSVIVR